MKGPDLAPWLVAFVLLLTSAWFFPYFPRLGSPNELTRLYLTRAIVDDGSLSIDRQVARHGPLTDLARHEGRLYSDKAPGIGLLGVPVYAAMKLLSGWEAEGVSQADLLRALRICLAGLPLAAAALALWHLLAGLGLGRRERLGLTWAYGLGSLALPYGGLLFGHQATAACLVGAWALVERHRLTPRLCWPPLVGLLLGLALLLEHTSLLAALPLALAALVRFPRRARDALGAVAGGFLPLAALALYQTACFGAPWAMGYGHLASPHYAEVHARGLLGLGAPSLERLGAALFGATRGLFFYAPWLALGLLGLAWAALRPRPGDSRAGPLALGGASLLYFLFAASLEPEAWGWSLGPRHLVPMLPFWTLGAGWLWARGGLTAAHTRFLIRTLVPFAMLACGLPFAAFGGFPPDFSNPLADFTAPLLLSGCASPGMASALGLQPIWGLAPFLALVLGVSAWLVFRGGGAPGFRLLAAGLALALSALAFSAAGPPDAREARALDWARGEVLQCASPDGPAPTPGERR
jgi:hypothetical protein